MLKVEQLPDGTDIPAGWVCEIRTCHSDALVLFTPSVVQVFDDYDKRQLLSNAAGDEINKIQSCVIPYGTFDFKQMMFVYSAFWSDEDNRWEIDIDLAAKMEIVGHI